MLTRRPLSEPNGNRLLGVIGREAHDRLSPDLNLVRLPLEDIIDTPGEASKYVYFPTTAVLSMLCRMNDGASVETSMVGNEGTTAMATCLGVPSSPAFTIVQVAGESLRIRSTKLKKEFDRGEEVHDLLLRYTHALGTQVSQSVGCNTHHLLEARLSRWLLIVRDRVYTDELTLQHQFISQMLGAGRSAVTIAAGSLRDAGLIRYSRGKITIVDRPGLEKSACECYTVVQSAFEAARLGG